MSTKNLARTVTEGRRSGRSDRHYLRAETRADERAYISEVKADVENSYDYDIPETRTSYGYCSWKWGPINRWLSSHCGQPWNEVRSEVTKIFGEGVSGHGPFSILDRILRSVEETPDLRFGMYYNGPDDWTQSYRRHSYYVDEGGILREKTVIKRDTQKIPAYNTNQLANWLSGRVVGKVGNKYFWFIPSDKNKKRGGVDRTWRTDWGTRKYYYNYGLRFLFLSDEPIYKMDLMGHRVVENGVLVVIGYETIWKVGHPSGFRQGRKLDSKELNFWNTLPEYYQTKVLELSPTYPNPPKPDYNRFYW